MLVTLRGVQMREIDDGDVHRHRIHRSNARLAIAQRVVHAAQDFMTLDDLIQRPLQRIPIELPRQAQGIRHVVLGTHAAIQLIDEPQSLLRE